MDIWVSGVDESIKKCIMFMTNASQMWRQLEMIFLVADGSRKYQLNKLTYETLQKGRTISEYYTEMSGLWEELESLIMLPSVTPEVQKFMTALKGRGDSRMKMSANVCSQGESSGGGPITAQQLEQLLRMLPVPSKTGVSDSDDDMEACFAEMVTCNLATSVGQEWIIDSGATHHMTGSKEIMTTFVESKFGGRRNLPNG